MKKEKNVQTAYSIAQYLVRVAVIALVIIFILWAINFMGPLNRLIF